MDFRSGNKFNLVTNVLSGNYLPLSPNPENLNIFEKLWALLALIWQILFYVSNTLGAMTVPPMRVFEKTALPSVTAIETIVGTIYLNSQRKNLRNLIKLFNEILIDSDILRRFLSETIDPHKNSLKMYLIMYVISTTVWCLSPLLELLIKDQFSYDDFIEPAFIPGEVPFGANVFIAGVFFQFFALYFAVTRKVHIDIYVSYFVTILTAEYKYIRVQIANALHTDSDNYMDGIKNEEDVISALNECVKHHCIVIKAGKMLVDTVAVQIGTTYMCSILRFCFLGFSFITFADTIVMKIMYILFGAGTLIQVYIYCSCIQDLLEASAAITDDAFHEHWHGRGKNITKILTTLELSNKIECRLSAYRIVDMTTPTLASILNKAYSACLILLKAK